MTWKISKTTFGEDLNGDGTTGPSVTQIATNGVTELDAVANQFELNSPGETTGPFVELNGSPVTNTQFPAGWTPVGAVQTATGYEVAFGDGKGDFVVWNTDGNGNFTSAATGVSVLLANSNELAGLEANFGDGKFTGATVGPAKANSIADNGTTTLNSVGNLYELTSDATGTGPLLELNGSVVTQGQFPAGWTPVGALWTGDGYEVAFGDGKGDFVVWNTDANGNFTSAATGATVLPSSSTELAAVEANFGDGTFTGSKVGPAKATSLADNTVTTLNSVGNLYELTSDATGTGPLLEFNGSVVTSGQFGGGSPGWTPLAAIQTGNGYEVAWGDVALNEYTVWNVGLNGNYTSSATGILSGTTSATELGGIETNFGDGNFAGVPAATATPIATPIPGTVGGTTLTELEVGTPPVSQTGDVYELNPAAGGTGPLLEFQGSVVTAGEFGPDWAPVGAVETFAPGTTTATGYQVAWGNLAQDMYVVWNTDLNGDYTSAATATVAGENFGLEDLNPTFGVNLNNAPSLSQQLFLDPTKGNTLDLSAQTETATIDLGANTAHSITGLNDKTGATQIFTGSPNAPWAITLGAKDDIVEYALAPASGIETVTGFNASIDELNIALRGAPGALQFNDTFVTVNNVQTAAVSIYSSADPSHGLVLVNPGETATQLQALMTFPVGGGHALITAA